MPIRPLVLAVALLLAVRQAPGAGLDPDQKLQLAKLDTGLIALLLVGFEGVAPEIREGDDLKALQAAVDGVRPVPEFSSLAGPVRGLRIPSKDPWGRAYRLAATQEHLVVLSVGPDGISDLEYGADDAAVDAAADKLVHGSASVRDDIVWIDGRTYGFDAERGSKVAMSMLRSLATAVESYAVDNNAYPSSDGRLVPIDAVTAMLEPVYIKTAPRTDPWGFPFLFVSDGKHYLIVSHGSDGTLEETYTLDGFILGAGKTRGRGPVPRPEDDLVFCDGSFAQWHEVAGDTAEP